MILPAQLQGQIFPTVLGLFGKKNHPHWARANVQGQILARDFRLSRWSFERTGNFTILTVKIDCGGKYMWEMVSFELVDV